MPLAPLPPEYLIGPAPVLVEVVVEVGHAGARGDRGEHLRHDADEGRALSSVAVAVDADVLRIRVAQLDHLARRRLHALEHVTVRHAGVEEDIGQHRDVAVADGLHRRAAHPGEVRRRVVAVEVLRVLLVERHEHRPLLAGLVVVGQRENALEPPAVLVLEVEQHAVTPQEVCLLRVGVADLRRAGKARARDPQVRVLDERLAAEEVLVGLRRLHRVGERRVFVDQLPEVAVRQFVEARLLRPFAIGSQRQRFRQVERAPRPDRAGIVRSKGSGRIRRKWISFFVPTPFVRFVGADPSNGSRYRSY